MKPENTFDPYSSSENFVNRPAIAQGLPKTPIVPYPDLAGNPIDNSNLSYLDVWNKQLVEPSVLGRPSIGLDTFSYSGRYSKGTRPGDNWEEAYAQNQEWYEKGYSGVLKGLNLAATTVAGGFGTLYGATTAPFTGKLSDIWDNPIMNSIAEWNDKVDQEYLPNFYTQEEQDANWYSTDNWLTANFLFDKLIKNAGFAVGAMYSGNIANAFLTRAGGAIGRMASVESSLLSNSNNAYKTYNSLLSKTARAFSQGKNIEASKILQSRLSSISDIAQRTSELNKILNTTSQFANFGDKGRRALIALYASSGEASFEALWGSKEYRDKLIQEYVNENGREPEGDDLSKIDEQVSSFGKTAFIGNMALLGVTEFVQLPYLMGSSYAKSRKAANEITNDVLRKGSIYDALPTPTSSFGKLYQGVKTTGKALAKGRSTYLFDPKEMAQEMGQYALQVGAENYYNKAFSDDSASFLVDGILHGLVGRDEEGEGVGALNSKEGIEGGILGGLTGGLMQAKRKYVENKTKKTNTERLIEDSKNSPSLEEVIKDRINTVNRGVVLQKQQQDAVIKGDVLESKDLKTDLAFNYGINRIKYGRLDLILDEIQDLKTDSLDVKLFAEIKDQGIGNISDTQKEFNDRLTELETFFKSLNSSYEKINSLYGPMTVEKDGKQTNKYSKKSIEYLSYAATKIEDYTKRIKELSLSISSKGIDVSNINNDLFIEGGKLKNPNEYYNENEALDVEQINSEITDYIELNLRKQKFINEYKNIVEQPDKFVPKDPVIENKKETSTPSEEELEPKETINLVTNRGKKDIEIGSEYYLGKVVEKSKTGQPVYRSPLITILGKNEDDTIKIKTAEGDILDVNSKDFLKYKLDKVEDIKNNPKAKFVMDNWNVVFSHKGIKDEKGNPVRGRIEDSDKPNFLTFSYINDKGKLIKKLVHKDSFNPAEGYKKALIVPMEKLNAIQQASYDAIFTLNETPAGLLQSAINLRNEFITEYYNTTIQRNNELTENLKKNKDKLESLIEEIKVATTLTKDGKPRKTLIGKTKKLVNSLLEQQSLIENEINDIENELDELNEIVPVLKTYLDELKESKDDNREILKSLNEDVDRLENLIDFNNEELKTKKSLLKQLQDLLNTALNYLNDFIKRIRKENPGIPISLDDYQSNIEKYMGEEAASQLINDKLGFTETVSNLQDTIEDFSYTLDIPSMQKETDELIVEIDNIEKELNNAVKEQIAKKQFLNEFSKFVEKQENAMLLEDKLKKDNVFKKNLLATADKKTVQTAEPSDSYEPSFKKAKELIPISTTSTGDADYIVRSNAFGFRFETFENKEKLKGVVVNINNQNEIAPGLIDSFVQLAKDQGKNIDPNKVLALVMVEQLRTGQITPVDEFGKPITNNDDLLDKIIYQVYPLEKLTWSQSYQEESMFRDKVSSEEQSEIREKYAKWRNEKLQITTLEAPVKVKFSFGIPQIQSSLNEEGEKIFEFEARNSVEDSYKIDDFSNVVLYIPKTNKTVIAGTVNYESPLGFPILMLPDGSGARKLENRKLTEQEVETVYESILEYSKLVFNGKTKTPEADRLLTYLKSIVYWGVPTTQSGDLKPASHNSVFFTLEDGGIVLKIGKEKIYDFTPFSLDQSRELIINDLRNLYNNINSSMINNTVEKYEQITSIKDGDIQSVIWPNYQTFLLSKTDPSGKLRNGKEIPLTTNTRVLKNENDVNREGIYFYTPELAESFKTEITKNKPTSKKNTKEVVNKSDSLTNLITEIKKRRSDVFRETKDKSVYEKFDEQIKRVEALRKVAPTGTYVLDGETINIYKSPSGSLIAFIAKPEVTQGNENETISILGMLDVDLAIQKIKSVIPDISPDQLKLELRKPILIDIVEKASTGLISQPSSQEFGPVTFDDMGPVSFEEMVGNVQSIPENFEPVTFDDYDYSDNEIPQVLKNALAKSNPDLSKDQTKDLSNNILNAVNKAIKNKRSQQRPTRLVLENINDVNKENWKDVEKWLKKNLPNIPIYRVKNIIQATNGRQAWGMFRNGAIYVYENAEVGTTYHEVFHAVWRMFTSSEEQKNILKEITSREGTFFDRKLLKNIEYKNASEEQLEEALAEEFKDYVITNKSKSKSFIHKLFYDLVNFIKSLFKSKNEKSLTEKLFENINQGSYKQIIPYSNSLEVLSNNLISDINDAFVDDDSVFSLAYLKDSEKNDIIQEMTYQTIRMIIKDDKSLFNVQNINKKDLYNHLKKEIKDLLYLRIAELISLSEEDSYKDNQSQEVIENYIIERNNLINEVDQVWDDIVERHGEYLKSYNIEFDENDNIELNNEDKVKEDPYGDPTKIDSFKKASPAIKLLLSTLPMVDSNGDYILSSIGGYKLLPASKAFITVMNALYDSQNIDDMLNRLKQLALSDINYIPLYERIAKNSIDLNVEINNNNINDINKSRLLTALWKTFKKQLPTVLNLYVLENGQVVVGNANFANSAEQFRQESIRNITQKIKTDKKLFLYNESRKSYFVNSKEIANFPIGSLPFAIKFLNKIGIDFTDKNVSKFSDKDSQKLLEIVGGIKSSILKANDLKYISAKSLDIYDRLFQLGLLKAKAENPEFDSTFFNISGERTQSYIGVNSASELYSYLNNIEEFTEAELLDTPYQYLLTDSFAKGSDILKRKFNDKGKIIDSGKDLLSVGYIGGTSNAINGKRKSSATLTYKERIIQELNLNLEGWYGNLIPGDASLEWIIKMGNPISTSSLNKGRTDVYDIFKEYLSSELEVSKEIDRNIANVKGRQKTDLRFFKDILGQKLHDDIVNFNGTFEELYNKYSKQINSKLDDYFDNLNNKYINLLKKYKIYNITSSGEVNLENVNIPATTQEQLDLKLKTSIINYAIANIEMHKLIYSDPYQYKDEMKRIKSFTSPRQAIINNSTSINNVFNNVWNKDFDKKDIGYTNFNTEYFKSVTYDDIIGVSDVYPYDPYTETDGAGMIMYNAYRHLRIRAGEWNDAEEYQFRYDVAWEKRDKGLELSSIDERILSKPNPQVKSAYTPLKPIVSGNKNSGKSYNDILLDKFALYPLSYRILKEINPNSNALNLYNKAQKENIDYIVYDSSRKVSNTPLVQLYNNKGEFNNSPYKKSEIVNVPFKILGIQSEVPSKDTPKVTRGSQITKLATLDLLEAGVPQDYFSDDNFENRFFAWNNLSEEEKKKQSELYAEISNNKILLEEITNVGFYNLMDKLGIKEKIVNGERSYYIDDLSETGKTLREEILKREVNDNISDSLRDFIKGKIVLESTPAYQQIRNILYSIADKEVISPKISGGMKVQLPSTLLESVRAEKRIVNGKDVYTSNALKFYSKNEDGKTINYCEIMLGRWFNSKLSDEEILNSLYEKNDKGEVIGFTKKGKDILSGIGFRIPTQKQNSIDVFIIKKFLPKEFGDSVIIPAELVAKVGSDFDIDKLSVYLKNLLIDDNGNVDLIPFYGIGDSAISQFKDLLKSPIYEKRNKELEKLLGNNNLLDTLRNIVNGVASEEVVEKWVPILANFFPEQIDDNNSLDAGQIELILLKRIARLNKKVEKITNLELTSELIEERAISMYKQSLENAYINSLQRLVSNIYNYERLMQPNSAEYLKNIAKNIAKELYGGEFDYSNVGNMLDRTYMSRLRHSFVTGKRAIGIAAVNQTLHSLSQRQPIILDKNLIKNLDETDRSWIGNGEIKFKNYNKLRFNNQYYPTISMIKAKNGKDISDINGQVIDGYVDISKGAWIIELGMNPNVTSTWLFLNKLGVSFDQIAYFMNQPLIRQYLNEIENSGYSYLFINNFLDDIKEDILSSTKTSEENFKILNSNFSIPDVNSLSKTLNKEIDKMTSQEKIAQLSMVYEFLKYAKMAEQIYMISQGTNFDTSTFNDPFLIFKKLKQLEKGRNTLFVAINSDKTTSPAADSLLENSFIGNLGNKIIELRDVLSTILISDQSNVREVLQKTLEPYVNIPEKKFLKLAHTSVNNLFDWSIQTTGIDKLNNYIIDILGRDGVASEINKFFKSIKNNPSHELNGNIVIDSFEYLPSQNLIENKPYNLKIKNKENKTYDQNNMIYAFKELKSYLEKEGNKDLYDRLVLLSILQSGLSNSPISFTSMLPQEDVYPIYNNIVSKLNENSNIEEFYNLNVLERNNWNDNDVIPHVKASFTKNRKHYNPSMKFLPEHVKIAVEDGVIPQVVTQHSLSNAGKSEIIVFSWELQEEVLSPQELKEANENRTLYTAIHNKKEKLRKAGDYSYIKKGLFKKVRDNYGTPLLHYDNNDNAYFIYKAMNAWGDSFKANEFYDTDRPSVFDNGFIKVKATSDSEVISIFDRSYEPSKKDSAGLLVKNNSLSLTLKDGKTYNYSDINSKMLESMGYSALEIGKILKQIC